MATLRKDPNGKGKGEWWVDHTYRLPDGSKHRERFKLDVDTEEQAVDEFERWKAGGYGKAKAQHEQRKRAAAPRPSNDPTIADLCHWYTRDLQPSRGDEATTITDNERFFRHWVDWLKANGIERVSQLAARPYVVTSYVKHLLAEYAQGTACLRMSKIRSVFRNSVAQRLIREEPVIEWPKLRWPTPSIDETITPSQFADAMEKIAGHRWYNAYVFLAYIGCRPSDVAALKWSNVNLDERTVAFRQKKTSTPVVIPLAEPVYLALLRERDRGTGSEYVFTDPKGEPIRTVHVLKQSLKRHTGITPRQLRQYVATELAEAGYDNSVIKLITGHKSGAVEVYKRRRLSRARAATEAFAERQKQYDNGKSQGTQGTE